MMAQISATEFSTGVPVRAIRQEAFNERAARDLAVLGFLIF